MINAIQYGLISLMILSTGTPATTETEYKDTPTGGVVSPIMVFIEIMIPNWTGSKWIDFKRGIRTGTISRIIGVASRIVPIRRIMILITSIMIIGLEVIFKKKSMT